LKSWKITYGHPVKRTLTLQSEVNDGLKKRPISISLEKRKPVRGTVCDIEDTEGGPRKRWPKKFEETYGEIKKSIQL